jgi:alkyl hydroperoxide reductase subunit F
MYDLIIIGGGPAGITAGIYAARKKINTLLITKEWGGQIISAPDVQNWPGEKSISGPDLMKKMVEHLRNFQMETKENREVIDLEKRGDDFVVRDNKDEEHQAKAIIIATGKIPRALNIPGEKEFKGKGISFCSTCDAPMFKDKEVAVVGGGNVGFDSALDLTKYAKKIYILEFLEQTQGDITTKEKLEQTGKVEIHTNVAVKEIKGTNFVESLIYENRDTGQDTELKIQGVFIAVGMMAKAGFVEGLVEFDKTGEIKIDKNNNTKTPGLFAAGDITDVKYEQIVIAASEGAKSALSASDYLKIKQ